MTLGGHANNKKNAVYLRFSDKPRADGHILPVPSADQHRSLGRTSLLKGYDQDSFAFEAKQGKADPRVKFLSRGPSHAVYLTQDETVVVLPRLKGESPALNPASDAQSFAVLRMRFVGANRAPHVAGSARLPSAVTTAMRLFWQILYNAGADLVINGHAHNYERFAPQDCNGNLDLTKELREFVVGTGSESLQAFTTGVSNSEVRNGSTYGVLKLTLRASAYDWQFVQVAGQTFTDSGSQVCH